MTDFPNVGALPCTIWTGSKYGVGVGSRGISAGSAAYTSTAWGVANIAYFIPMFLPFRYPVKNLFVYNFATLNGNVDVGIYNSNLVLLASVGSGTAQAGATALQFFAKDILLDPGQYYFAMSSNSTTATYAANGGGNQVKNRYLGIFQQATAFPLPATATPAANSAARIPLIGATYMTGTPNF